LNTYSINYLLVYYLNNCTNDKKIHTMELFINSKNNNNVKFKILELLNDSGAIKHTYEKINKMRDMIKKMAN
jgi:hypothetical protein